MSESRVEVETTAIATGGDAIGRLADGRVVFVRGALPGERVVVEVELQKKRFARAALREVLSAAPERIDPSCSHALVGECGGCDWMHASPEAQRAMKQSIVIEQLERLGGVGEPTVTLADSRSGGRTSARCIVTNGRAGYRSRRANTGFEAETCSAVHPALEELIVEGRFGEANEVTLRIGASTGERLALVEGGLEGVRLPEDVLVVDANAPGSAAIHEAVAGRLWRISARSFFQTSLVGAESLVSAVGRALDGCRGAVGDLYAGVGLLGGAVAPEQLVVAVEQSESSVADARHNLGSDVSIVAARVEEWTPQRLDAVIADPARRGLTRSGADVIAASRAERVVLVSCDPASLGRDAGLLAEHGYSFVGAELVDMFPDTSRIEVVSRFEL